MLPSPPRHQRTICLVAGIAVVAACSKAHPPAARDAAAAVVVAKDAAPPPPPADADEHNRITISFDKPHPAGSGLAKRCVLGGDPLVSECIGGGDGIALANGELYVVAGTQVHRYRRAAGEGCRFDPAGAPIDLPREPVRSQSLDGPVYMRSGGPAWRLASSGNTVYAYDFLAGLYLLDGSKPTAACTNVFGYNTVAIAGKRLLVARNGIEQLAPGKHCTAHAIDAKARGDVYAIGDHIYNVPSSGGSEIVRYDGSKHVAIATGGARICSIVAMTACGAGVCFADQNCMQLVQLAADGSVQRMMDADKLFDQRPWSLGALVTEHDGGVLVLARHRDKSADTDKEVCEAAVYELPAALFGD
jgi:hypothetical protein